MTSLRKEAQGRLCQVRIPFCCSHDPETVVLAHLNGGKSLSSKNPDWAGAWCCAKCHDALDGRVKTDYTRDELRLMHLEGMVRTLQILFDEGKLRVC